MNDFSMREGVEFVFNFYRKERYDSNRYLITTDDGNFIFLKLNEMKQLKRGRIVDVDLYKMLIAKGIVITEDNFDKIVEKTRVRYSFLGNGTSLHIVIPTSRCNLGCYYCFASPDKIDADKSETDMTIDTARKTVDFILQSPCKSSTIEFTGGEALARFDLIQEIVLYAREMNKKIGKDLRFTVVSNLVLMNDEIANWLIDNEVTICTSLDGPKEVHDKNRIIHIKSGKEIGTFDRVIYWIKRINQMYIDRKINLGVAALMTTTKNSFDYHKEIIDLYLSLNLSIIDIRGMIDIGRANEEESDFNSYSKKEFVEFYEKCIKYIDELKSRGVVIEDRMRELYKKKIHDNVPTYHTDYESPDGAATGTLTYHSNGSIYTCHEALGRDEFKLGSVYTDTWEDLFNKDETSFAILSSMLESNPKCDTCAYKPYCGTSTIENITNFGKVNFYPNKTSKHHETILLARREFNEYLKEH